MENLDCYSRNHTRESSSKIAFFLVKLILKNFTKTLQTKLLTTKQSVFLIFVSNLNALKIAQISQKSAFLSGNLLYRSLDSIYSSRHKTKLASCFTRWRNSNQMVVTKETDVIKTKSLLDRIKLLETENEQFKITLTTYGKREAELLKKTRSYETKVNRLHKQVEQFEVQV